MGREETVRFRCSDGRKPTFGIPIYSRLGAFEQLGLPLHGLLSDRHDKFDGNETPTESIPLEAIAVTACFVAA